MNAHYSQNSLIFLNFPDYYENDYDGILEVAAVRVLYSLAVAISAQWLC